MKKSLLIACFVFTLILTLNSGVMAVDVTVCDQASLESAMDSVPPGGVINVTCTSPIITENDDTDNSAVKSAFYIDKDMTITGSG